MAAPEARKLPTVVVKLGTSSILRTDLSGLALSTLAALVEALVDLRRQAKANVVLVSSGAVGVGCLRLRLAQRPEGTAALQAMAAIGQPHLMRYYDELYMKDEKDPFGPRGAFSQYYYQCIANLFLSGRDFIDFVVWTAGTPDEAGVSHR